jgi:hypothetical protein
VSEERFNRIESRLDTLRQDVVLLKQDVAQLKTDVAGLKTDLIGLRDHMGTLHEEVIDRIKGISVPMPVLQRMVDVSVGELREEVGRRLDPLELTVRDLVRQRQG